MEKIIWRRRIWMVFRVCLQGFWEFNSIFKRPKALLLKIVTVCYLQWKLLIVVVRGIHMTVYYLIDVIIKNYHINVSNNKMADMCHVRRRPLTFIMNNITLLKVIKNSIFIESCLLIYSNWPNIFNFLTHKFVYNVNFRIEWLITFFFLNFFCFSFYLLMRDNIL